jgi:hypothetical protein
MQIHCIKEMMMMMMMIILIIICTINSTCRVAAALYTLETWFVSGIYV